MPPTHEYWMNLALCLARRAMGENEVPVGAIIIHENGIVGEGFNQREGSNIGTHHAEILAIEEACQRLGRWRLKGCTLYVTLEPCVMCAGAIVNSRIDRLVYGASDPKAGGVESLYQILQDARLNHRPEVIAGVLKSECSTILTDFFRGKRNPKP